MLRKFAYLTASLALLVGQAAQAQRAQMDPDNPTCPLNPNVSSYREMRFTEQEVNGKRVLLAEGMIDDNMLPRLQAAVQAF